MLTPDEHGRGEGRTTLQMQQAKQGAIYIWNSGSLSYPIDLSRKLHRTDLTIWPRSVLTTQEVFRFHGLAHGREVVIDHAIQPDSEASGVIFSLCQRLSVTQFKDLPETLRATLLSPPIDRRQVLPFPKLTADVMSWSSIAGTGLTVRDENSRKIGTLKFIPASHETPREDQLALMEQISRTLSGEINRTILKPLPQHEQNAVVDPKIFDRTGKQGAGSADPPAKQDRPS